MSIEETIQSNYTRYQELCKSYKIAHGTHAYLNDAYTSINQDDYDVIVECIGHGYAHTKYRVVKNAPALTTDDLAIICDRGNLCFGYRTEGGFVICVYTD